MSHTAINHGLVQRVLGLRRRRRLTSVILRRLGISSLFTMKADGVLLRFHPAVWPANLWEKPDLFHNDTHFLRRYLRKSDTVIDAGANIGFLTIVASSIVGNEGRVYSIEAHPKTYRFLMENLALNHVENVQTYNVALGDVDGFISFSDQKMDDGNHVISGGQGLTVPLTTLDNIIGNIGTIHLLKVDVEGYEKMLLEGAPQTLSAT